MSHAANSSIGDKVFRLIQDQSTFPVNGIPAEKEVELSDVKDSAHPITPVENKSQLNPINLTALIEF